MNTLLKDLRYGFRMLMKDRVFAGAALLTLALGIAANTVIFSIVHAVLLRPLPFRGAERLVLVNEGIPKADLPVLPFSAPDYRLFQEQQTCFEETAAFQCVTVDLDGGGVPERVKGARVSVNLFPMLGINPVRGRSFQAEEDRPGEGAVILSYGLWKRRFGADPALVGKTIRLNRHTAVVVGVLPEGVQFPLKGLPYNGEPAELFFPIAFTSLEFESQGSMFNNSVVGRLKPGVSLERAREETAALAKRIDESYPAKLREVFPGVALSVEPLQAVVVGDVRTPLFILLAAVALVLLIGCANVANLLLARAAARRKEIAIRGALGASPARLVRQMLTEGLVLSVLGGALGVLLAAVGKDAFLSLVPEGLPRAQEIGIDGTVLLYTLGISLLTTLVFGLAPGLMASRTSFQEALAEGGRSGGASRGRRRLQSAFVVVQVALALVLLTGAGLLVRSFLRLLDTDPGFKARRVLTFTLTLPHNAYDKAPRIRNLYDQVLARTAELPGVRKAAAASSVPLEIGEVHAIEVEGHSTQGEGPLSATQTWVQGDYFEAMQIPLRRGRVFTEADRAGQVPVAVVSESMARAYWPSQDPLGKRIRWGKEWLTVVGTVADVKDGPLHLQPKPRSYSPYAQEQDDWLEFPVGDFLRSQRIVVASDVDPLTFLPEIRAVVKRLDPELALSDVRLMEDRLSEVVASQRFSMMLLSVFAGLALLLSAVGIYGVMSYSVAQRTHEMGVRIALGARGADILRLILGQAGLLIALGLVLGLAGALALTRVLESMLFGIPATDPATFVAVPVILALVGLLAGYIPAFRATRIDPLAALRYE
ncbi:MAG: ABC transporter permease [Acidobacteria bacterium]|nr:ABC transporter permease [Acidobacteriota bacterium]